MIDKREPETDGEGVFEGVVEGDDVMDGEGGGRHHSPPPAAPLALVAMRPRGHEDAGTHKPAAPGGAPTLPLLEFKLATMVVGKRRALPSKQAEHSSGPFPARNAIKIRIQKIETMARQQAGYARSARYTFN